MRGGCECDQGLVQPQRLPICLLFTPVARVTGQAISEFMVAPVLRGLVAIGPAVAFTQARRVNESEPQSIVIKLVGSLLAIRKNGHPVNPALFRSGPPI